MIGTWICMLLDGDFSGLFFSVLKFVLWAIVGLVVTIAFLGWLSTRS